MKKPKSTPSNPRALPARSPVAATPVPRALGAAFTAGSHDHPDMRRWYPSSGSADADLLPELGTIRSRARDLARNHGVAEGAVQTLTDNVVGSGFRLKSRPNWRALGWTDQRAEEWSNDVEARWSAWADNVWCDAAEVHNFAGLTALIYRNGLVSGDALAIPLWLDRPFTPDKTALQVIESDRLCNPNGVPDRGNLRGGIEIDEHGAPVAYWIRKVHPGDRYLEENYYDGWQRIEARTPWGRLRIIHVANHERAEQSRGKPAFASVLRQFRVLGEYTNAELKAAVVNAMVALVTKSSVSQEHLVELLSGNAEALKTYQEGLANRGRTSIEFNAGMVVPLGLGEDLAGFTPARPVDSFAPFVDTLFRHIAAGLNIPYELLMKDFSKTNYSSARAALLEGWRFFRGRRRWLTTYWAQPVFELWLEEQVQSGRIHAPDFYSKRAHYCRARWIGDGRGWVDPLKEAQAAERRIQIGVSTLEDEIAEQGGDWEETLEQRAREERRARSLGITLPWMSEAARQPQPPAGQQGSGGASQGAASQGGRRYYGDGEDDRGAILRDRGYATDPGAAPGGGKDANPGAAVGDSEDA